MPFLYVRSTGSNTPPYSDRATAAQSLATATAAAGANDTIFVFNGHTESLGTNPTYAPLDSVQVISTSDWTNEPPVTFAAGAAISTTTTTSLTITSGYWRGFTFTCGSGVNTPSLVLAGTDNRSATFENCTFAFGATGACSMTLGTGSGGNVNLTTINCTFSFSATNQTYVKRILYWKDYGSNMSGGASQPTALFSGGASGAADVEFNGSDFSSNSGTYFANTGVAQAFRLTNCKLHASATIMATQTADGGAEVYLFDSAVGDVHYNFAHYSYRGNTVVTTAKYANDGQTYDGTNHYGWTVTGVNATYGLPYYSPWIDQYNAGTSSVTPYFEIARDGSSTAYTNAQVWGEFMVKTTSGFATATLSSDRMAALGTAANQAAGAATWTGLGTNWVGKIDSGSAVTPAELGYVRGRVVVAAAITVQADPKIRGL